MLAGVAVLLFGRRLFWLFVGVVGFVFGSDLAAQVYAHAPPVVVFVIALAAGIVGAVLAYFLQNLMVAVAGFVVGSQLGVVLFNAVQPMGSHTHWVVAFLVGGIIGAALLVALFDSALILLSSVFGASLVIGGLDVRPYARVIVFLLLSVFGILVQANWAPRPPRRRT